MSTQKTQKTPEQRIPGMVNRRERFQEVEHAENAGKTLRRVAVYFFQEKAMVLGMLAAVGLRARSAASIAPSLQSRAIDILAGTASGNLLRTVLLMLAVYVLYCLGQLLQNLISARLSQNIVRAHAARSSSARSWTCPCSTWTPTPTGTS